MPAQVPAYVMAGITALVGLTLMAGMLAFALPCDTVDRSQTAAAVGVVNAAGLLGGGSEDEGDVARPSARCA